MANGYRNSVPLLQPAIATGLEITIPFRSESAQNSYTATL